MTYKLTQRQHELLSTARDYLRERKRCTHCSVEFVDGLAIEGKGLNVEFLVHLQQTHGIPPETFQTLLIGSLLLKK